MATSTGSTWPILTLLLTLPACSSPKPDPRSLNEYATTNPLATTVAKPTPVLQCIRMNLPEQAEWSSDPFGQATERQHPHKLERRRTDTGASQYTIMLRSDGKQSWYQTDIVIIDGADRFEAATVHVSRQSDRIVEGQTA